MRVAALFIFLLIVGSVSAQEQTNGYKHKPFDCNSYGDTGSYRKDCELRNEESAYAPNCAVGEFWSANMTTDPMTDKRSCSISPALYDKEDGGLFVYVDRNGISFSTMGDEYPGEPMRIRVDKNPPITFQGSLQGKRAAALLNQISAGKIVLSEYQDWPYNTSNVRPVPICDLPEKVKTCRDFIK